VDFNETVQDSKPQDSKPRISKTD